MIKKISKVIFDYVTSITYAKHSLVVSFLFMSLSLSNYAFAQYINTETCSNFPSSSRACIMEYDGVQRGRCEVCRENRSCFMALDGEEQHVCMAYRNGKSCFMALDGENRGWCEVIKEGKSCTQALSGYAREQCQRGFIPTLHYFWSH